MNSSTPIMPHLALGEYLTERFNVLQEREHQMKLTNFYFLMTGTVRGCPGLSDEQAAKLDARPLTGRLLDDLPYPLAELKAISREIFDIQMEFQKELIDVFSTLETFHHGSKRGTGRKVIIVDVDRMSAIQPKSNHAMQDHSTTILDFGTKEKRHEL